MDRRGFLRLAGGAIASSALPVPLLSSLFEEKRTHLHVEYEEFGDYFGKEGVTTTSGLLVTLIQINEKSFPMNEFVMKGDKFSVKIEDGKPKIVREHA